MSNYTLRARMKGRRIPGRAVNVFHLLGADCALFWPLRRRDPVTLAHISPIAADRRHMHDRLV